MKIITKIIGGAFIILLLGIICSFIRSVFGDTYYVGYINGALQGIVYLILVIGIQ